MRLLVTASHTWSEVIDKEDLSNILDHLLATLTKTGPVQVSAPANRPSLVSLLEEKGWFPVAYSQEEGPPYEFYDRAFFLSPSPLSDEVQLAMTEVFSSLAATWLVVHIPPGSTRVLVQRPARSGEEGGPAWRRPEEWDLEVTMPGEEPLC